MIGFRDHAIGDAQIQATGDTIKFVNPAVSVVPTLGTFVIGVVFCECSCSGMVNRPTSLRLFQLLAMCLGFGHAGIACHMNRDRIFSVESQGELGFSLCIPRFNNVVVAKYVYKESCSPPNSALKDCKGVRVVV